MYVLEPFVPFAAGALAALSVSGLDADVGLENRGDRPEERVQRFFRRTASRRLKTIDASTSGRIRVRPLRPLATMIDRRTFIKTTGALSAGIGIAGCMGDQGDGGGTTTGGGNGTTAGGGQGNVSGQGDIGEFFDLDGNIAQNSDPNLKFLNTRLVRTGGQSLGSGDGVDIPWFGGNQGGAGVMGRLKNTADRPMTYVEVTATLYDQNGNILGTWGENTEENRIPYLRPNETWDFRIWFESVNLNNAARYTVSADGQLADNGVIDDGQGDFLFGGDTVDIGPNGQVIDQNGDVIDNVTILQDNQDQGPGFENVQILPDGQVVNDQGQVVGRVQVNQGPGGGNATSGNNSTGGS